MTTTIITATATASSPPNPERYAVLVELVVFETINNVVVGGDLAVPVTEVELVSTVEIEDLVLVDVSDVVAVVVLTVVIVQLPDVLIDPPFCSKRSGLVSVGANEPQSMFVIVPELMIP